MVVSLARLALAVEESHPCLLSGFGREEGPAARASRSVWGSVCTLAKRRCDLEATGGRKGAAERMRKAAEGDFLEMT